MKQLTYEVLREKGYQGYLLEKAPEKVLQFGEGNFLRAFAQHWFDLANEKAGWNGKCVLVQPRGRHPEIAEQLNRQEGLYTLYLRGSENGQRIDEKRVISSVSRCLNPYVKEDYEAMMQVAESDDLEIIVSNTTEAGITYDPSCSLTDCPPKSFPGKLTQVLYRRYQAGKKGVLVLACELIDHNGEALLNCVNQYISVWGLEKTFYDYVNLECTFCGSLVDRIVPGAIRNQAETAALEEENGYKDDLADVGEIFGLWVIEGNKAVEEKLPFAKAGLKDQVFVVPDMSPYKKRKVRILNGAHTGFVPGAYLAGKDIVRECMEDEVICGFMNKMLAEEVLPTLPMDQGELKHFAAAVQDRFNNPFVDHALLSISLNSTAKWKARNLPTLLDYIEEKQKLPVCLTMSLAAYLAFYTSKIQRLTEEGLVCVRPSGNEYIVSDDRWVLEFYEAYQNAPDEELVHAVLSNTRMWDQDLTRLPGLEDSVLKDLRIIREKGARAAFESCL